MASLTLSEAEQILAGAKAKVVEMGANMSVSVLDPRGDLITMMRTDGASWRTPAISRAKAVSSACFILSIFTEPSRFWAFWCLGTLGGRKAIVVNHRRRNRKTIPATLPIF